MLCQARGYLKDWEQAGGSGYSNAAVACIQALAQAYQSLLAEVLESCQLPVLVPPRYADQAADLLARAGQPCPAELNHIRQLELQADFLCQLSSNATAVKGSSPYSQVTSVQQVASVQKEASIPLTNLEQPDLPTLEMVRQVLHSLSDGVAYARNFSFEW